MSNLEDTRREQNLGYDGPDLQKELFQLRSVMDAIRDYAVIGMDLEGRISEWNSGAENVLGWNRRDALGRQSSFLFTGEDVDRGVPQKEVAEALEAGSCAEERWHLRRDGTRFWGSGVLRVSTDRTGRPIGFVKVMRDLTQHRAADQKLQESEERFRLFVENVRDYALIQLDTQARISSWNKGAEHAFGYSEAEIVGQSISALFAPEDVEQDTPQRDLEEALRDGRSQYERWLVRRDGSRFWARWVTTPMFDDLGDLRGFAKVLHDETERKETDERLRAAVEEKNVLVQEVHHRVKNNLQVINSLLTVQADRISNPEAVTILEETQNRVSAIAAIHEQLYSSPDLSSINFGPYTETLLRGLLSFYGATAKRVNVKFESDDIVLDIQLAVPLGLIVNELVTNVLKHAFPNGRKGNLKVELRYLPERRTDTESDDRVQVRVQDDGIGLPADLDLAVADSMGMHLVAVLVEQIRGEAQVDRMAGTDWSITFPLGEA